ncbi:hypothetical protein BN85300840 [Paracholeplasma brassicae]|uniref:Oligosaccharide repeat unit polymerase n=1 Tax=Acholeplasma brassicae TaxID=61635 RepID=U4KM55_9MOLU|nr:hypothetical protein [Paracholeplasma brassicae]CCV65105.1 hypothetical protein BN85300840 [Paracholeplasma brassicae]
MKNILIVSNILLSLIIVVLSVINKIPVISLLAIFYTFVITIILLTKSEYLKLFKYLGFKILFVILEIRYIIMPLFIAIVGKTDSIGRQPDSSSILVAVIFMIIEMLTIIISATYFYKDKLGKESIKPYNSNNSNYSIFYIGLIIISIVLLALYPRLLGNFDILSIRDIEIVSYFRGFDIRIIRFTQILITIYSVSFIHRLSKNSKFGYYVGLLFSLTLVVLSMSILQSENRASFIISAISYMSMISWIYRKNDGFIKYVFLAAIVLIISIITLQREKLYGSNLENSITSLSKLIQVYFSGPNSVANSIDLFKNDAYLLNAKTFLTDVFLWSGYLGNVLFKNEILQNYGTSYRFNYFIYEGMMYGEGDQIIPLIGQSIAYFKIAGIILMPTILTKLLSVFDTFAIKSCTVDEKYIFSFITVVFGLFPIYNISILGLYFFDRFLIMFIFYYINKYVNKIIRGL